MRLTAEETASLPQKGKTRLIAVFDGGLTLRCGLNPMGEGRYFIMLSKTALAALGLETGQRVEVTLYEDPDPLGAEMPEELRVLLDQNPDFAKRFEALTDGGKRTIIHGLLRIKSPEKRIEKAVDWLTNGVRRKK